MKGNIKNVLLVLLGLAVLGQMAVTLVTWGKLSRVEEALSVVQSPVPTTLNQADDPVILKSPLPVDQNGAPTVGPSDAKVKIVEFTDYECSFCKSVQPTIKELLAKYEGKIQYTVRNYPISSIHAGAVDAALAGYCAHDQEKFWEMHDAMFEKANNSGSLSQDVLKQLAKDQGLSSTEFDKCLDSKKYIELVQKDFEDGSSYTVSGTPTFFINDQIVTGSQPLEVFSKVIDEELGM